MSNAGVNAGFAKCFIFFMAFVILLQGGVYLGLSIWGITLRECSKEAADISMKPLRFVMDLVYFLNEDCGNPSVKVPDMSEPITLDVDFKKAEVVENRAFIFFISYAVISALWIITSLVIIASLCGPITKTVNSWCFWPWFLVIIIGSILDAVATGYHIHDIINTTSVVKTFNYLGIQLHKNDLEAFSNFDVYFITPAVIITCISARVIIIWLLNIFGSSFCLSLSNTLSKRDSSKQSSATSVATISDVTVTNLQQPKTEEISNVQIQRLQTPSKVTERCKPALATQTYENQSSGPRQTNQHSAISNINSPTAPEPNLYYAIPSSNELDADLLSNRLNSPSQLNVSPYQEELSPLSPLNNRYSTNNESFQFPNQNQRVSEELRGQLPWSYTSMPPPVPKKLQTQVYPEIQTPDYGH